VTRIICLKTTELVTDLVLIRLTTSFVYLPRARAPRPSRRLESAYQGHHPILGPSLDPEGWETLPKRTLSGVLFGARKASLDCTVRFTLLASRNPPSHDAILLIIIILLPHNSSRYHGRYVQRRHPLELIGVHPTRTIQSPRPRLVSTPETALSISTSPSSPTTPNCLTSVPLLQPSESSSSNRSGAPPTTTSRSPFTLPIITIRPIRSTRSTRAILTPNSMSQSW
jgi:hypothetical protein